MGLFAKYRSGLNQVVMLTNEPAVSPKKSLSLLTQAFFILMCLNPGAHLN